MENISKMKAGEGSESKISEAMSYLNRVSENNVVDINTGEVKTISGSPLQSPSLYAILSGEQVNIEKTKNFASDRVLKVIENTIGVKANTDILRNTTASTGTRVNGTISRYVGDSSSVAGDEINIVVPIVDSSLTNNSFENINGIMAGEFLVEGAVNIGKELAKASGATAGSTEVVRSYARLNSQVLAMDAEVDRMTRSPFDITSKNTFLGSIIYKFALSMQKTGAFNILSSFTNATSLAMADLLPASFADDSSNTYLSNFGNCTTYESIGAVGSATCSMIATFDTSTLDGIFSDPGFIDFVNKNTSLINGTRTIKKNSMLDNFINFNNNRVSPVGVMDSGILSALLSGVENIPIISDAATLISNLASSDDNNKRIATGAAFVNSSANSDWQTYKYAQRYVSLARATNAMRQTSGDATAYNNLMFF